MIIPIDPNTETGNRQEVTDTDLQQPPCFAIRNGLIVEVSWNDLTESEKRDAYVAMFSPCDWE